MNILSLFDDISCARVALERSGMKVDKYYSSEVDKYAIEISKKNWPDTIQMGDVKWLTGSLLTPIDLLIGGSPCQDLSIAKQNRKGLSGERSGLFWEYVRILKEVKPKWFILENVASMSKESKKIITDTLGVEPIMINASLVSAQSRKRLFWTNIPGIDQPEDRGIMLKDILENGYTERDKSRVVASSIGRTTPREYFKKQQGQMVYTKPFRIGAIGNPGQANRVYSPEGKSVCLQANCGGTGAKTGLYMIQTPRGNNKGGIKALDGKTPTLSASSWEHNNKLYKDGLIRKLTPIECERLQGLPDNYTEGVSNTQRYKMLGNAFNVDVVAHILKHIVS